MATERIHLQEHTCCFLEDLWDAERIQDSLCHCSDCRADLDKAVQAVSVFYCEAVTPEDERKTQETLSKILIKTMTGLTEEKFSWWRIVHYS